VRSDDLPPGVNALASADGKTIIVRDSLDPAGRRRAMREVLAAIRRFPRLALVPVVLADGARSLLRRSGAAMSSLSTDAQQLAASAAEHVNAVALAVTAVAGTAIVITASAVMPGHAAQPGARPARPDAVSPSRASRARLARPDRLPTRPLSYLGVYEPGVPGSFGGIYQFAVTMRHHPDVALYFSGWNEPFQAGFAEEAYGIDAIPAVQIEPYGVSLAALAAGKYDAYLRRFADQVRAYGHPVIIGFAHEPDGNWYPWGPARVSPGTWIAAWRHVVSVFRAQNAGHVTWLWTINAQGPYAAQAARWYPGAGYVTWIGVDGYYTRPGDTFSSVFGAGLAAVRGLDKPVLIAETAVGPGPGQSGQITDLFSGVRRDRLLGLVWFDVSQDSGQYHQDWRLEGDRPAAAAFARAAGYIRS